MTDPIKVLIKEPGKEPVLAVIPNDLKSLQKAVGGYIEVVQLHDDVVMAVNEEGKIIGLDENFRLKWDTIVGPAVFLGIDGEDFDDFPSHKYKTFKEVIDYDRA